MGGEPEDRAALSGFLGEVTPPEAWDALSSNPHALLIDVRTQAELAFVGGPDLGSIDKRALFAPWQRFPDMAVVEGFASAVLSEVRAQGGSDLYFICRSGARSLRAAMAVAQEAAETGGAPMRTINVAEGFEGDLDENRHRGRVNGWKVRGLPWAQS